MNTISIQNYSTPFGELILGSFKDRLCICDWRYRKMRNQVDERIKKGLNAVFIDQPSPIIERTIDQLTEYFAGVRKNFDLPLELVGSDFQQSVWNALMEIKFGETNTYLGLSTNLGNPKAIRAVASANGANAISIIVPCHRIIGSDNSLIGYAGGLPAKKKLLQLEGALNQLSLF